MGCILCKNSIAPDEKPGNKPENKTNGTNIKSSAVDHKDTDTDPLKGKPKSAPSIVNDTKNKSIAFVIPVDELKVPSNTPLSANHGNSSKSEGHVASDIEKLREELKAKELSTERNRLKELEKVQRKALEREEQTKKVLERKSQNVDDPPEQSKVKTVQKKSK